jgi:hypothetical protein
LNTDKKDGATKEEEQEVEDKKDAAAPSEKPPEEPKAEESGKVAEKEEKEEDSADSKKDAKDSVQSVKDRRDRRDAEDEPNNFDSAMRMVADQDEDIESLLQHIEQVQAKLDYLVSERARDSAAASKEKTDKAKEKEDENDVETEDKKDVKDVKEPEKEDRKDSIDDLVNQKVEVLRVAERLNLDGLEGKSLIDARKAVVLRLNPNMRLDGKSDDYISAAFDIAKEQVSGANYQRRQMFNRNDGKDVETRNDGKGGAEEARQRMVNNRLGVGEDKK